MNYGQNRGITLIALVISIVVLVILAGVSVNLLFDNDGIIAKSKEGTASYLAAEQVEQEQLSELENTMNSLISGVTRLPDLPEETAATRTMITKWNIESGEEISIMVYSSYDYENNPIENNTNFTINWGDGTQEIINSSNMHYQWGNGYISHTYATSNPEMLITVDGICKNFNTPGNYQLTEIVQWGSTGLKTFGFGGSSALITLAVPTRNSFKDVTELGWAFSECTALTSIPENLFANCPNVKSFQYAFATCSNLATIPEKLFANCINVEDFEGAFSECTLLTSIPENLFANCQNVKSFQYAFASCPNLTAIPENLFANCTNVEVFEATFADCTKLTIVPENIFTNCSNITNFQNTFSNCTSLTNIPQNLFANCLNVVKFGGTFASCYNLTGTAPSLWSRVPNGEENGYDGLPSGQGCFYNCTNLNNYMNIPDYWKEEFIQR